MAEQRRNPTKQSSKRKSSSSPSILDRLAHLEAGLAGAQKEISFKEIDEMLTMCMQNHENLAALMNCKNILCLLDENSDGPIYDKYSAILTQLRQKELEKNQLKWTEIEEIHTNMEKLSQIISVDPNVAPDLEDLPLSALKIDDLSLEEMVFEADKILERHRIKLKHSAQRDGVVEMVDGRVVPLHQEIQITPTMTFDGDKDLNKPLEIAAEFIFDLDPSAADPVESVFFEDVIPYNYEVVEIELNGAPSDHIPTKLMRKDGLQLSWRFTDLKNEKCINLKYLLRPRVSRTVLVPTSESLQVIHTHSSLDEADNPDGVYRTRLEFKNQFAQSLNNVLMEDIIPDFYTYEVEEKKQGQFSSSKQAAPFLVKWRLFDMANQNASEHEYQLTEFEVLEIKKQEAERILAYEDVSLSPEEQKALNEQKSRAAAFLAQFRG